MSLIKPLSSVTKGNKEVLIFGDIEQISEYAVEMWLKVSEESISRHGGFTAALSGGKTPVGLYRRLAVLERADLWDKTNIFLVDERFVPFDDIESNYNMIRQTLLSSVSIPDKNIHPIPTNTGSSESAAAEYEEDLISFFKTGKGGLPRFNIVFLGMGDDGHTASIFPGSHALSESVRLSVAVNPSGTSKKERVSITLPVINNSENIVFLVTGEKKSGTLLEVLERPDGNLPASHVQPNAGNLLFLVDKPASRLL